jgi:hypothetical protein
MARLIFATNVCAPMRDSDSTIKAGPARHPGGAVAPGGRLLGRLPRCSELFISLLTACQRKRPSVAMRILGFLWSARDCPEISSYPFHFGLPLLQSSRIGSEAASLNPLYGLLLWKSACNTLDRTRSRSWVKSFDVAQNHCNLDCVFLSIPLGTDPGRSP